MSGDPWDFPRDADQERQDIENDIRRWRGEEGLPLDHAVVERLVVAYETGRRESGMWLLPEEEDEWWAECEDQEELWEELSPTVFSYAENHASSYATTYQAGSFVHVGFATDVDRHRKELLRRVARPDRVRVFRALYSKREVEAVEERIWQDAEVLATAGVELVSGHEDEPDRNGLVVQVIAADADAAQRLFGDRYGDIARVEILGPKPTRLQPVEWGQYALANGGKELTIYWITNEHFEFERTEVEEDEQEARVAVLEHVPVGIVTLPPHNRSDTVTLQAPLSDRVVRDVATGKIKPRFHTHGADAA